MRPVRREGGFVLVLVLAMLVVLSLLAGSIAATTSRLLEQATQRERGMQDQLDMASTRATVLYLIGTQRLTVGGLTVDNLVSFGEDGVRPSQSPADIEGNGLLLPVGTEIAMDGRAYRGIGNARFAIQDENGLFAVNWNSPARLERLLAQGGQQRPVAAPALFNRIMDYQDRDNLYRLDSLEADGYRSAFALAEFDAAFGNLEAVLADTRDGKPLGPAEGPFRLVLPTDARQARAVRQITRVELIDLY